MNKNAKTAIFVLVFMTLSMMAVNVQTNAGTAKTAKADALPATVNIGFLYPATGALGSIGAGLKDGAMAAAYRLNATYGKFFNVTIDAKDTATDPATAKTSAQALVSDGVQVIIGAAASGATLAASQVTIPDSIPLISYASTSPSITALNDSDFVMRVVANDNYQGVALAKLAMNESATKVYVLNLDNAYGNGVVAKFSTAYSALGGTIVGQTAYDPASTSFSTEVSNIKSSGANGVVMVSYPTDANYIFGAAKAQGINLPFFGTDGIATSGVTNVTATRNYLNGNYSSSTSNVHLYGTTPSTGANATSTLYPQFLKDLTATGGSYGVYGDYVYDAFLIAGKAINMTQDYNGAKLKNNLYAAADGFVGATGTNKAFNCAGDPVQQAYDYWNATDYNVTTMISAAVSFSGLGSPTNTSCGLNPYSAPSTSSSSTTTTPGASTVTATVATTATTSVRTPGFELFAVIGLLGLASLITLKRKRN